MAPMPVKLGGGVGRPLRDDRRARRGAGAARARPFASMSRSPGCSPTGPIGTASRPAASAASTAARGPCRSPRRSPAALRFGVAGCQNYEDGYYTAYRHLAREELAFVYHYGDYIYEYRGGPTPAGPRRRADRRGARDVGRDALRHRRLSAPLRPVQDATPTCSAPMPPTPSSSASTIMRCATIGCRTSTTTARRRRSSDSAAPRRSRPGTSICRCAARRCRAPATSACIAAPRCGDLAEIDFLDTRQFRIEPALRRRLQAGLPGGRARQTRPCSAPSRRPGWRATSRGSQARWNCLAQQIMMMSLDRRTARRAGERSCNLDTWAGL